MAVTLLGPQRRPAAARAAVGELIPDGPIATINAGWQEREPDTGELAAVLGGRSRNLRLFARWQELQTADPGYAEAEQRLLTALTDQQRLYALRLRHQLAALASLRRQPASPAVEHAVEHAVGLARELDDWHLAAVARLRVGFAAGVRLDERPAVAAARSAIAEEVSGCRGVVITGGHVGVLLHVLELFDLAAVLRPPLIAWSAGAMACAERVVLYGDFAASGPLDPQYYASGLGLFPGVVPLPHARRRLDLDDHNRLELIARRFAPRACLLLADGERVDIGPGGQLPPSARVLGRSS